MEMGILSISLIAGEFWKKVFMVHMLNIPEHTFVVVMVYDMFVSISYFDMLLI